MPLFSQIFLHTHRVCNLKKNEAYAVSLDKPESRTTLYLRKAWLSSGRLPFLLFSLIFALVFPPIGLRAETTPDLQAILQDLHHPDEHKRRNAMLALQQVRVVTPEVLKALGNSLNDSSHDVQRRAVSAIARLAPATRSLLPKLMIILEDQTKPALVRTEILHTVIAIGGLTPEIVSVFKQRARDSKESLHLRWQAYRHLRMGESMSGLRGLTEEIYSLLVKAIINTLNNPNETERVEALRLIGNNGPKTPEVALAISKALFDVSEQARNSAVSALGRMGPVAKNSLPQLLKLLQNPTQSHFLRFNIPETIVNISKDSTEAINGLVTRVQDSTEDLQIRWKCFQTLGKMGNKGQKAMNTVRPGIEKVTLEIAQDKKSRKRKTALGFISEMKHITPAKLNLLVTALSDPKEAVRSTAVSVIQRIGTEAESMVPALISLFKNRTVPAYIRRFIPKTIMRISKNPSRIISPLIERLQDPEEQLLIRWKATQVLGKLGPAAHTITSTLYQFAENSREPALKAQAWLSLAHIQSHNPEIIQKIVKISQGQYGTDIPLGSSNFYPVYHGLQTLIALGEQKKAITSLIMRLQNQEQRAFILPLPDFAVLIQEMGEKITPFLPSLLKIVQHPSRNLVESQKKYYLLLSLSQVVPESKPFQQALKAVASSDPLPVVRQNAQMLLKCFDPLTTTQRKAQPPCTGYPGGYSWEDPMQ